MFPEIAEKKSRRLSLRPIVPEPLPGEAQDQTRRVADRLACCAGYSFNSSRSCRLRQDGEVLVALSRKAWLAALLESSVLVVT